MITVGVGGPEVEQLPGAISCIAPVGLDEARSMVAEVPLLTRTGARDTLAHLLVALGDLTLRHPVIAAVDISPVVLHEGRALALDAMVVVDGGER